MGHHHSLLFLGQERRGTNLLQAGREDLIPSSYLFTDFSEGGVSLLIRTDAEIENFFTIVNKRWKIILGFQSLLSRLVNDALYCPISSQTWKP